MAIIHDTWAQYALNILHRGATPPDAAKWQICLSDSVGLTRSSAKADFIAAELPKLYGYQRLNPTWSADASYNTTLKRAEMAQVTAEWTITGQPVTYSTAFLMADARPEGMVGFASSAIASNQITLAGHGLTTGEEIMLTPAVGGTIPTALSAAIIYQAIAVDANTFSVSTDSSTPLSLAGASGNLQLRYAAGRVHWLDVAGLPITRNVGQRITLNVDAAFANMTYGTGV
jgi:hypothetical protein